MLQILDDKEFGCPKLQLTGNISLIPADSVVKGANIYHDCRGGNCRIVNQLKSEKIEQENVLREKAFIKHNSQYKIFILNIYGL